MTGLPRAGTTLACQLLNLVPDVVALDEPAKPKHWGRTDRREAGEGPDVAAAVDLDAACRDVEAFMRETRASILDRGTAPTRQVGGEVLGSKYSYERDAAGERRSLSIRGEIAVAGELSPSFLLVVKHNSAFAALLDRLVGRFPVYAIVRNPLAILGSWQTAPVPPREGRIAAGERFDPQLAADLARFDDRLARQLHLLHWFFARFRDLLPADRVVSYESMVASGGAALSTIVEAAGGLSEPLEDRNTSGSYDRATARALGERLLATNGAYWAFYSRESVEALM
jgi:hypothetical protein